MTSVTQPAVIQEGCQAPACCAWPGSKVLERITVRRVFRSCAWS